MNDQGKSPVDNPILGSTGDVLGRAIVAHDFAQSIRELDASQGIVVGVLGAWGHGKTSFVNLMREQFAEAPELAVVDFNPWLFSGQQQLSDVFFREIAAELRLKDQSRFGVIAEGLNDYGDVLSPLAIIPWFGGWFDRAFKATKIAATWLSDRKKGSRTLRDQVTDALTELEQPIVVVIDDIDRLTSTEIRDIFKLVRLTASFPNVVYLLAFDRTRVEQALSEEGVPGRAYLAKILQLSFDVPMIPRELLRRQVFERLEELLDGIEDLRFTQTLWADIYFEVIEPLIGNLRDVTRFALSARPTLRALGGEVETVDLLALEALRVFRPELFQALHTARIALTQTHDFNDRSDTEQGKAQIDALLAHAENEPSVVPALIHRVFPAALFYTENNRFGSEFENKWRRERRVAHISHLDLYFGRSMPSDLVVFHLAERANALLSDRAELEAFLDSLPRDQLEDVIAGLESYEDEFPQQAAIPASIVLLNKVASIPERAGRGMFDVMSRDIVVTRVVLRLLRRIDDEAAREQAVRQILQSIASYSSQELLIRTVGHQEGSGSRLISTEAAEEIEEDFAQRVRTSPPLEPSMEWNWLRVLWLVHERDEGEYAIPQLEDPTSIRALLQSGKSVARSQSWDSHAVQEEPRLAWDLLVQVVGGEEALREAIQRLRETDGETPLVALATKYSNGWRPELF